MKKAAHATETERAWGYISAARSSLEIALRRLPEDHRERAALEIVIEQVEKLLEHI
jgi:hypothetical protein